MPLITIIVNVLKLEIKAFQQAKLELENQAFQALKKVPEI